MEADALANFALSRPITSTAGAGADLRYGNLPAFYLVLYLVKVRATTAVAPWSGSPRATASWTWSRLNGGRTSTSVSAP